MSTAFLKYKRYLLIAMILLAAGYAHCREPNPPNIQAIIGMKIPPQIQGKRPGQIPELVFVDGELLTHSKNSYSLALEAGFLKQTPAILVVRIAPDKAKEIADIQVLHAELLEWQLRNGKVIYVKGKYRQSNSCEYTDPVTRVDQYVRLIGLVKPLRNKDDCSHMSGGVKQAWGILKDTGKIVDVPTNGLMCHYITMGDCE